MKTQTTINLPIETKKQVRTVAAELDISMGNAALELIKIGLVEYRKTAGKLLSPVYTMDEISPVMGDAVSI